MNIIKNTIAILLLLFISLMATETKKVEKHFPVSPEVGIEIISVSGMDVTIKTWDKQEVYFNLEIEISSNDSDYEQEYIKSFDIISDLDESKILIEIVETDEESEWSFWDIFSFKIGYYVSKDIKGEIFIPKQNDFTSDFRYCDINLLEVSGKLTLNGKANDLSLTKCSNIGLIENSYGDIKIENCGGNLELLSRSSENSIKNFNGNVTIKSDYSDLTIHSISGNLEVSSRSADINIKNISKSLTIDADYSDIEVHNVAKAVSIKDRSGNINLDKVGSIELEGKYSDFIIKNVSGSDEKVNKITGRSGNINVLNLTGGLIIKSDYSDMELDSIKGNVGIESRSNSIDGKNIAGNLNLQSEYSNISLLNINSRKTSISNRSEDIVLDFINTPAELSIITEYCDIVISIPKEYSGEISIESINGNIESGFEFEKEIDKSSLKKRFRKGSNNSIITIENRSGDIELIAK